MKKKYLLFILMILMLFAASSCVYKKIKEEVIINDVTMKDPSYENVSVEDLEDAICLAIEFAEDSVVGVITKGSNILFDSESTGSGVILKRFEEKENNLTCYRYYVVTNRHVISSDSNKIMKDIYIYLGKQQEKISAKVVKYDDNIDIALLEFKTSFFLPIANIEDEINIKKGRFAIAIGSPYELETFYNSVTVGNISAINRLCVEENIYNKEVTNVYIQHNAQLNPGNSGGGLFDIKGNLIGINTWKIVDSSEGIEGMEFSIPISIVTECFKEYL